MADKFGLGLPSAIVKSKGHFPGQQYGVLATRLVVPGLPASNYAYGFGEIVKIVDDKDGAYTFRAVTADDTTVALAVVMRDIVGGTVYDENVVSKAKSNVAASLFLLNEEQYGAIAVPCASTTSVVVGGAVYVGLGTGTTVAGSTYGAAQGAAGVDSVALTGYTFRELPYKPSDTNAYAVIIGRKLDI